MAVSTVYTASCRAEYGRCSGRRPRPDAGCGKTGKRKGQARAIAVVAYLLAHVATDGVGCAGDTAFHRVRQGSVKRYADVVGSGQAGLLHPACGVNRLTQLGAPLPQLMG